MEGPPLGPGGEDITWPDRVAPRGRKASSTRKIKPQTSNLTVKALRDLTTPGNGLHETIVDLVIWRARRHALGQHVWIPPVEWGQALTHDTDTNVTRRGIISLRRAPAENDHQADPNHPEQWEQATEAGSDPRGHLGVTWGVYLCAGKPPLADIILSHPPDLTRCDSVIGLAIPAMSGHIQYRGTASGDLYIGISGINRVLLS